MIIATTYENGEIYQHFGHSENFKLYTVEDNKIIASEILSTGDSGHGALAALLSGSKVDVLICGGIGGGAKVALANAGIKLYPGVSGNADQAVEALINGKLDFNPDAQCDHHEHAEGHDCGNHHSHSCGGGSHSCGNHGCH